MKSSRFSDGGIGWAKLGLRAQESVTRWEFDDGRDGTGNLLGMYQQPAPDYIERFLPIEKLLLFRTTAEKGNHEGKSMLRSAWFEWLFFKRFMENAAIGIARDLGGLPVLKGPAEIFRSDATSSQQATLN